MAAKTGRSGQPVQKPGGRCGMSFFNSSGSAFDLASFGARSPVDRVHRRWNGVFVAVGIDHCEHALLGNLLLPDMLKKGYHPTIAIGPIMAVGGIAMLIPPSALAVLLASLAERSITDLLMAGVVPGILMAASFVAYVVVRCKINPDLAPPSEAPTETGWARIRPCFVDVLPLFIIFAVVVGSIFFRIAAPEEAAALGCIAALGISALYGKLKWPLILRALRETAKINVMLLFIIAGSLTFARALRRSGVRGDGRCSDGASGHGAEPADRDAHDDDAPAVPWVLSRPDQHDPFDPAVHHAGAAGHGAGRTRAFDRPLAAQHVQVATGDRLERRSAGHGDREGEFCPVRAMALFHRMIEMRANRADRDAENARDVDVPTAARDQKGDVGLSRMLSVAQGVAIRAFR